MVQISVLSSTSLPVLESSVAGAARFVEAIRGSGSGRAYSGNGGGATVFSDRQLVAASGRFAVEAKAQSAAASNAVAASSLLQTADDALVEIGDRLGRMTTLAESAAATNLSDVDRAQLDAEFQTLKSEIDAIAAATAFNGLSLLQGGAGPGGAFEITFKVGTGAAAQDDITVSIAPASVSDLSAGLAADAVTTQAGAVAAQTNITDAVEAVDAIRAGIAGDKQRFAAAFHNSRSMQQGSGTVRETLTSPSVAVDLSRLLAQRIADEGGIELSDPALDHIRQLLIGLELPNTATGGSDDADTGRAAGAAAPAAPQTADTGVA